MEHVIDSTSLILTLDLDDLLFKTLDTISKTAFTVVEINQAPPDLIKEVIKNYPKLRVGVGNIINIDALEAAEQSGAHFASSLGFLPALVQTANLYQFNYLPGIATFSEAMMLTSIGCKQARPIPANKVFCAYLNKYMPTLRLFPAEVSSLADAEALLELPSVAAVSIVSPDIKALHQAFQIHS